MSNYSVKYKHLSPEQKEFVSKKTISATFKIGKWLNLLGKISKFDKHNDALINKLFGYIIGAFVLSFFSLFTIPFLPTLAFPIIVFCIGIGVALIVYRNNLKAKDVNDYLRSFFIPVLSVLEKKCGPEEKISATVDFRDPRRVLTPTKSKVGVRTLKTYNPKYIIARLTLKDESVLEFVVADDIKDFTWKKRSASGKTKFKKKSKFVHHCFIKITLPKSSYKLINNQPNDGSIKIEQQGDYYIVKGKIKLKSEGENKVLPVSLFLDQMQNIYNLFEAQYATIANPQKPENDDEHENNTTYVHHYTEENVIMPYIWSSHYFNDYDYDGFEYAESGDNLMDDDAVTAFDS